LLVAPIRAPITLLYCVELRIISLRTLGPILDCPMTRTAFQMHFGNGSAVSLLDRQRGCVTDALPALKNVQHRAVVLIDGLDHVAAAPGAADLYWLPSEWPANISLVVTDTNEGYSCSLIKKDSIFLS
jgi:hypothetical protein